MNDPVIFILTVFGMARLIISFIAMLLISEKFPDKPKNLSESIKRVLFIIFIFEYGIYLGMKGAFSHLKYSFVPEDFKLPSFPKISIKKLFAKEDKIKLLKKDNQYRNVHCENCNCK